MDENASRTTAMGLLNTGHSYWVSARALQKVARNCTHPDGPVDYLYFHAIELLLKAYLLHHGEALKKLRSKGHNINALSVMAEKLGLSLKATERDILANIPAIYMQARYIMVGRSFRFRQDDLHLLCDALTSQIAPTINETNGVTRSLYRPE